MKIHEMLADRANYPDAYEVTAPNGEKVKLGDFREAFYAREIEISKREGEIQANARLLETGRQELAGVFEEFGKREAALTAREAQLQNVRRVDPGMADIYEDKYVQPLVEELRAMKAKLEVAEARVDKAEKNQLAISESGLKRFWDMDAELLKKEYGEDVFPEGIKGEDLASYAWKNGLKTIKGEPDLRRAAKELTSDKRIEKAKEAGKAEGLKLAQEAHDRAALLGTSSGFIPRGEPDGKTVFDRSKGSILKQAIGAAAKDPVVWSSGN